MKPFASLFIVCCLLFSSQAQELQKKSDSDRDRAADRGSTQGVADRAGGIHNKSNIGEFFENRGKLYARTLSQGVSGEFPLGSLHEYIYRVAPYVGFPGNVIQGRYTTNEEWEAVPGYANRDSAKIAFSDKPATWPSSGWPVKDPSGKPVIVSNQDSYCVYSDSNNTRKVLGIQVNQIGYAFSQKSIRDLIFFTFLITNNSKNVYDSLYFGMYADIEPGGYDVADDYNFNRYVLDKKWNRLYAYHVNGHSVEWNAPTGVFGLMFMQTPKVNGIEPGVTDCHWCLYADDKVDDDNVEFGRMASTRSLYESSVGSKHFHLGANAPNLHFDDFVSTQPAAGTAPISILSSGPYRIAPGDTLKFVTAMVAGNTVEELDSTTVHAYNLLANSFRVVQPPQSPKVTVTPGDSRVTIAWDNRSESVRDQLTGQLNFEGYRIYKSVDKGVHWDQIDRNLQPNLGSDPVPLASFDRVNGSGKDNGIQYRFVDTTVTNGFEYWYTVTAYSQVGSSVLESSRGTTGEDLNLVIVTPRSKATGRIPVTASAPKQAGAGSSKVVFDIASQDNQDAAGRSYTMSFAPLVSVERGNFLTKIRASIGAVGPNTSDVFSLVFSDGGRFVLRNLTKGTTLSSVTAYTSGVALAFEGLLVTFTDSSVTASDMPAAGDSVVIRPGVQVLSGTTSAMPLESFSYGTYYSTSTGLTFALFLTDTLASSKVTYNDKFTFATSAAGASLSLTNSDLDRVKVVPNPYMVSSLYEPEFGALRREPVRVLKFNNLPSRCTIYIFSVAGDKVQTIEHDSDNGTETWNLRASGGREIAPGVYLYLVKTDTAEKLGRFAVIK